VTQTGSRQAWAWAASDPGIVLWTLTPVEVASAIRRLVREDSIGEQVAADAEARLAEVAATGHIVVDVDRVKAQAIRLLRLHPLRASDALQLGAALHWAEGHPQGRTFHTLDQRLALAAQREGFTVPAV
jgi:predicted nucleic acid-binding protein